MTANTARPRDPKRPSGSFFLFTELTPGRIVVADREGDPSTTDASRLVHQDADRGTPITHATPAGLGAATGEKQAVDARPGSAAAGPVRHWHQRGKHSCPARTTSSSARIVSVVTDPSIWTRYATGGGDAPQTAPTIVAIRASCAPHSTRTRVPGA